MSIISKFRTSSFLLLVLLSVGPAHAIQVKVTSLADNSTQADDASECTLREAISDVNISEGSSPGCVFEGEFGVNNQVYFDSNLFSNGTQQTINLVDGEIFIGVFQRHHLTKAKQAVFGSNISRFKR